jgi:hypothetical protein
MKTGSSSVSLQTKDYPVETIHVSKLTLLQSDPPSAV